MPNYSNFLNVASIKDVLKPVLCKSCKDEGEYPYGNCPKCLANQAWNREYLETHLFITDSEIEDYHTRYHNDIKSLVLRLPNEHPYLYYGIELEIEFEGFDVKDYDDDGYDNGTAYDTTKIMAEFTRRTNGLFVYEWDSSLNNGVEMISRPCSYAFWTSKETIAMLKDGLEYLRSEGAMVNQPASNGMHIHISRKFFDRGTTKLEDRLDAYRDFDWLFQKFQPEMEALGERKYTMYCQSKTDKLKQNLSRTCVSSSRLQVSDVKMQCKLKRGGEMASDDHSSAVNLSGNTIEVRTFKSTTDYEKVLANIELVRSLAHAVRDNAIHATLNQLLHTKDNLFLDKHIASTRLQCKKNKTEFDLEKVNDDNIDVEVEVNN